MDIVKIVIAVVSLIISIALAIIFKINIVYSVGSVFIALYIFGMLMLGLDELFEEISDRITPKISPRKQLVRKIYSLQNQLALQQKENESKNYKHEQTIKELETELEKFKYREYSYNYRIATYDVRVVKEGEEKDFPHPAIVLVSSHQIITKGNNGQVTKVEKKPNSFYLLEFYWNNGGWRRFYNVSEQNNLLYELDFHKYISCVDSHGKKYQVLLTPKKELWKKWDLDNLTDLKKQLNKIYDKRNSEFKKIFNDTKTNYTYLAELISEFEEYFYNKIADELETKKHPASKSAEQVRELAQKIKEVKKENILLKGELAEYKKSKSKNLN